MGATWVSMCVSTCNKHVATTQTRKDADNETGETQVRNKYFITAHLSRSVIKSQNNPRPCKEMYAVMLLPVTQPVLAVIKHHGHCASQEATLLAARLKGRSSHAPGESLS